MTITATSDPTTEITYEVVEDPLRTLLALWVPAMCVQPSWMDELALAGEVLLSISAEDSLDLLIKYETELDQRYAAIMVLLELANTTLGDDEVDPNVPGNTGCLLLRDCIRDFLER